jgi:hypothetical protein
MLVKILDADPDFVEALKTSTGTTTGSKAYAYAAANYSQLSQKVMQSLIDKRALLNEIDRLERIIEGARSAAAQLLERTGQSEFDV